MLVIGFFYFYVEIVDMLFWFYVCLVVIGGMIVKNIIFGEWSEKLCFVFGYVGRFFYNRYL